MLYLLHGPNSFEAVNKINEIKKAFLKKNSSFLIEEVDGDDDETHHDFLKLIESPTLFFQKRLLVFKNIILKIQNPDKLLAKYADFLRESKDVFLFWEQNLKKDDKIFEVFRQNAAKIQETKEEQKGIRVLPSNSIFKFVDKIFESSGVGSILHLENAMEAGIDGKNLINVIFWKIKKIPKKSKRVLDLAYKSIIADLNLKMDNKSENEHISRLTISITSKV